MKRRSPIKKKLYRCKHPDCTTEQPILSKGLCNYHRGMELMLEKEEREIRNPIKRKKEKKKHLKMFFDMKLDVLKDSPYSQLSGKLIVDPSKKNIAHVLPKRKQGGFPSIAENVINSFFLTWQEHSTYDKLMDERRFDDLNEFFGEKADYFWSKIKRALSLATERNKLRTALEEYLKIN